MVCNGCVNQHANKPDVQSHYCARRHVAVLSELGGERQCRGAEEVAYEHGDRTAAGDDELTEVRERAADELEHDGAEAEVRQEVVKRDDWERR
jgi:hypothetical protein